MIVIKMCTLLKLADGVDEKLGEVLLALNRELNIYFRSSCALAEHLSNEISDYYALPRALTESYQTCSITTSLGVDQLNLSLKLQVVHALAENYASKVQLSDEIALIEGTYL